MMRESIHTRGGKSPGGAAALAVSVLVLALSAWLVVSEKREFSEQENRYLEPFPAFSWEAVKSGAYMEDLNDYLCDHFPLRDMFLGVKTRSEILLGRRKINGVFITSGGYLIEEYKKPENTERIGGILKNFAQKVEERTAGRRLQMNLMLVPTASCVYGNRLPANAFTGDQMAEAKKLYEASGMEPLDCSPLLLARREEDGLYYHTDHHWTTYGAYLGYLAFCEKKGLEPVALEALDSKVVTEDFRGTIDSRVNDFREKGDAITIYRNPSDRLTVVYEDTGEVSDSLYNLDYVDRKDKYSLFLNNLHSLITVTNEASETERELVLIKDSYANSMVPFLAHHYRRIHIFDTRYYRLGPSSYIESHPEVTDVLVLYNMNTLDSDLGIKGIY